MHSRERVDMIAFRASCSIMVESKVSRSDFLADRKKPERAHGGVGDYRFYVTPVGLITENDLPANWGLLYYDEKKIIEVKRPRGNHWPSKKHAINSDWADYVHNVDPEAERAMLFSITRRLAKGQSLI
jgi:hypothetical protein